ncbi:MAG: preprotein translocase subunit SecG [Oscillospiraceae bacterium]|jgi:preprotein translocase subunit SecG|nr:preprotein translocase subunit SecG [Oscillospiraceae bacterium]
MDILKTVLLILQLISCAVLVAVVMMQSGKESGLGALSGNSDSYMSRSKVATFDAKLARATKWIAGAFALLTLFVALLYSM